MAGLNLTTEEQRQRNIIGYVDQDGKIIIKPGLMYAAPLPKQNWLQRLWRRIRRKPNYWLE